jgi:hypothetical protein
VGSRRVVGFALGEHHDTELAHAALAMAVAIRGGREAIAGVIMHTDQGCPPSPESVKEASTPDRRIVPTCCRGSPTAQAISLSGRHNHEVGTIGVVPTSAQVAEYVRPSGTRSARTRRCSVRITCRLRRQEVAP